MSSMQADTSYSTPNNPKVIHLENPSFEGKPKDGSTPDGWDACGRYSTPDLQPGFWGVNAAPAHGNSFVGLIVREDNTWEHLGQHLSKSLKPQKCYSLSLSLAKAIGYSGYSHPTRLRIWGSKSKCGKRELLAETEAIQHKDWQSYKLYLQPTQPVQYLTFEAYYATNKAYKGNLLIDNCSDLVECIRA